MLAPLNQAYELVRTIRQLATTPEAQSAVNADAVSKALWVAIRALEITGVAIQMTGEPGSSYGHDQWPLHSERKLIEQAWNVLRGGRADTSEVESRRLAHDLANQALGIARGAFRRSGDPMTNAIAFVTENFSRFFGTAFGDLPEEFIRTVVSRQLCSAVADEDRAKAGVAKRRGRPRRNGERSNGVNDPWRKAACRLARDIVWEAYTRNGLVQEDSLRSMADRNVAAGDVGSHYHRNHRYPGTHPLARRRFFAMSYRAAMRTRVVRWVAWRCGVRFPLR